MQNSPRISEFQTVVADTHVELLSLFLGVFRDVGRPLELRSDICKRSAALALVDTLTTSCTSVELHVDRNDLAVRLGDLQARLPQWPIYFSNFLRLACALKSVDFSSLVVAELVFVDLVYWGAASEQRRASYTSAVATLHRMFHGSPPESFQRRIPRTPVRPPHDPAKLRTLIAAPALQLFEWNVGCYVEGVVSGLVPDGAGVMVTLSTRSSQPSADHGKNWFGDGGELRVRVLDAVASETLDVKRVRVHDPYVTVDEHGLLHVLVGCLKDLRVAARWEGLKPAGGALRDTTNQAAGGEVGGSDGDLCQGGGGIGEGACVDVVDAPSEALDSGAWVWLCSDEVEVCGRTVELAGSAASAVRGCGRLARVGFSLCEGEGGRPAAPYVTATPFRCIPTIASHPHAALLRWSPTHVFEAELHAELPAVAWCEERIACCAFASVVATALCAFADTQVSYLSTTPSGSACWGLPRINVAIAALQAAGVARVLRPEMTAAVSVYRAARQLAMMECERQQPQNGAVEEAVRRAEALSVSGASATVCDETILAASLSFGVESVSGVVAAACGSGAYTPSLVRVEDALCDTHPSVVYLQAVDDGVGGDESAARRAACAAVWVRDILQSTHCVPLAAVLQRYAECCATIHRWNECVAAACAAGVLDSSWSISAQCRQLHARAAAQLGMPVACVKGLLPGAVGVGCEGLGNRNGNECVTNGGGLVEGVGDIIRKEIASVLESKSGSVGDPRATFTQWGSFVHPALAMREVEGKGRGLVATSAIPANTLVMCGRAVSLGVAEHAPGKTWEALRLGEIECGRAGSLAVLSTRRKASLRAASRMVSSFRRLPHSMYATTTATAPFDVHTSEVSYPFCIEGGDDFEGGTREWEFDIALVCDAFHTSSFLAEYVKSDALGAGEVDVVGLYDAPSYINHSLTPNVARDFFGAWLLVSTLVPLKAGDEVTISYVPLVEAPMPGETFPFVQLLSEELREYYDSEMEKANGVVEWDVGRLDALMRNGGLENHCANAAGALPKEYAVNLKWQLAKALLEVRKAEGEGLAEDLYKECTSARACAGVVSPILRHLLQQNVPLCEPLKSMAASAYRSHIWCT